MSAAKEPEPDNNQSALPPDPREFLQVPAYCLVVDKRLQRLAAMERVQSLMYEFDWLKEECPTCARIPDTEPQRYRVIEGQHRVLTIQNLDINAMVWICVVPDWVTEADQAKLGHDISKSRHKHSALELWDQRLKAGDEHEVLANKILGSHGLRLGHRKTPTTIIAVQPIRIIVHGGGHTPEFGSELLDSTITLLALAWPEYDRESSVNRWDGIMLRVVASFLTEYGDLLDHDRFVEKLRLRPAKQWQNSAEARPESKIYALKAVIKAEYNRGLRGKRLP